MAGNMSICSPHVKTPPPCHRSGHWRQPSHAALVLLHAAAAGWPESRVRAIVGHTSAAVTRRYLHASVIAAASLPSLPDVMSPPTSRPLPASIDWRAKFHAAIDAASTPAKARAAVAALPD